MRGFLWGLFVVAVTSLLLVTGAYGHAIALSTSPAQHEAVNGPDVPVRLRFNSRIDIKRSTLILMTPQGERRVLTLKGAPAGDSLASEAKGLKTGAYILRWQVLASDGHITRGEVPFNVK